MQLLASMADWIQANPLLFTAVVWPLVTAGVSTFYRYLDAYPRWHSFLGLAVSFGWNLPAGLECLRRFLAQAPPPPPGPGLMGSQRPPPFREEAPEDGIPPPVVMTGKPTDRKE